MRIVVVAVVVVVVLVVVVAAAAAAAAVATVVVEGIITCQQELGCGEQLGPSKRNVQKLRGR
jgi:cell division septal protein FtsQ